MELYSLEERMICQNTTRQRQANVCALGNMSQGDMGSEQMHDAVNLGGVGHGG